MPTPGTRKNMLETTPMRMDEDDRRQNDHDGIPDRLLSGDFIRTGRPR